MLLWFETAELDATVARARALGAEILREPHVNARARHRECWLRDRDGYTLIASPCGDVAPPGASGR